MRTERRHVGAADSGCGCGGGRWPELARAACTALVAAAEGNAEDASLGVRLLSDIRDVFAKTGQPFLSSTELVAELRRLEDSPWDDFELSAANSPTG
ncbi:hypothetical protein I553_2727 [Mycobacterium xenopi 4042]|uniref:DUF3631 domain-containing protein n=1 Tax=Mycobacterium xenopi 4042 TaxID=1299334 RepID=X7YVC5_MYCXE|nr:hypothetical protein I553_2727 [Mycobacterium xenopi 4042]